MDNQNCSLDVTEPNNNVMRPYILFYNHGPAIWHYTFSRYMHIVIFRQIKMTANRDFIQYNCLLSKRSLIAGNCKVYIYQIKYIYEGHCGFVCVYILTN